MGPYDVIIFIMITSLVMVFFGRSSIFKYYFKFLIFCVGSVISATIFIPFMLTRPRDYRNALLPSWGLRIISKVLGVKMEIQGKKNIIQEEGAVILINHQSFIDLIVLAEIWPNFKNITVISKQEVFYFWPFGLAAWLWGTIFINRAARKEAQERVNLAARSIISQKAKICFFPEGTRHGGENLLRFKKGAFHIAIESQAPIQPIVVTRYKFLDWKKPRFDEGSVMISILPAISTEGLKKEDLNTLIDDVYNAMSKEYDVLNKT